MNHTTTHLTRRHFLLSASSLLGITALSACVPVQPATAPAASTAVPAAESATASGETRTITDTTGRSVTVPVNPQRIVAGYTTDVDVALILELPLIGACGARGSGAQPFAPYQPAEKLTNVTRITTFPEANLEQIAALQPDLIIDSVGNYIEGRIELFTQIAPTFDASAAYGEGWRPYLRAVGAAFGREELAEGFISDYESRVADLKTRLTEAWPAASFAVVATFEPSTFMMRPLESQPVRILQTELGLQPVATVPPTFAEQQSLSIERLDLLQEADFIFAQVDPKDEGEGRDRTILDGVMASPLWQQLAAVQAGQIIEYDAELFYDSPLTASAFLDTVEAALLK